MQSAMPDTVAGASKRKQIKEELDHRDGEKLI